MFGSQLTLCLASAGAFAALLVVGACISHRVFSRAFRDPPVTLLYPLAIFFGFLAVTPVLLAAAVVGGFSPPVLGLIGWIAVAVIRLRGVRLHAGAFLKPTTLVLLAISVTAGLIAYHYSGEHLYGGRDQGFYTNLAVWMANHGKTTVDLPLGLSDPALPTALAQGVLASGLYPVGGQFVSQFSHTYSAWLAQAYAIAGFKGMDAFNGLLAASNVLLFFALVRSFVRPVPALLAAAFLAFSPAQIWISRITLSELMAQQAILAMALLAVWAVRRDSSRLLIAAGMAAAFAFLTRIGGILAIPLLLLGAAAALLVAQREPAAARSQFWRLAVAAVTAFAAIAAYYWIDSAPYFEANSGSVLPAALATLVAAMAGFLFVPETSRRIQPFLFSVSIRAGVLTFLTGLFLWAYFVRPRFDLTFDALGRMPLAEVMRPFRVNALWNLGEYLSPIVLFAGFGGFCLLILSRRMAGRLPSALPFIAVWLGYALLLIQDPRISADHPWTIRRFVPVILPGFIFFAFLAVNRLESLIRRKQLLAAARLVIAILIAAFCFRASHPTLSQREFDGSRDFLAMLASRVPSDRPVFVHGSLLWALPLRMAFDRPVFRIDLSTRAGRRQAMEIATRFPDPRCAIVHDRGFAIATDPEDSPEFTWRFNQIRGTPYPLAHEWTQGEITLAISLLDDAAALTGARGFRLGGEKIPDVNDTGFWGEEFEGRIPFRWTMGKATIDLPVEPGSTPHGLRIHYVGIHPNGSDVVVAVNGRQFFADRLTAQSGSIDIDGLDQLAVGDPMVLSIESTPFRPVDLGLGDDPRELGMRITYIEVVEGPE